VDHELIAIEHDGFARERVGVFVVVRCRLLDPR